MPEHGRNPDEARIYIEREEGADMTHQWNDHYCSCGQDAVTCQGCGRRVCGDVAIWTGKGTLRGWPEGSGNIGPCCFARFGLGHAGEVR